MHGIRLPTSLQSLFGAYLQNSSVSIVLRSIRWPYQKCESLQVKWWDGWMFLSGGEAQIIGLWGSSGSKFKITRGGTPIAAFRLRDDVLRLTIIISRLVKLNLWKMIPEQVQGQSLVWWIATRPDYPAASNCEVGKPPLKISAVRFNLFYLLLQSPYNY